MKYLALLTGGEPGISWPSRISSDVGSPGVKNSSVNLESARNKLPLIFNVDCKKSVHRGLKKYNKTEACRVIEQLEKDLSKRAEACPVLKGQLPGFGVTVLVIIGLST